MGNYLSSCDVSLLFTEEEPKSPVSVRVVTGLPVTPRSNGVVRPTSPVPVAPPCPPAPAPAIVALEPVPAATAPPPAPLLDFAQEHSRPRTTSNSHGYVLLVTLVSETAGDSHDDRCFLVCLYQRLVIHNFIHAPYIHTCI